MQTEFYHSYYNVIEEIIYFVGTGYYFTLRSFIYTRPFVSIVLFLHWNPTVGNEVDLSIKVDEMYVLIVGAKSDSPGSPIKGSV